MLIQYVKGLRYFGEVKAKQGDPPFEVNEEQGARLIATGHFAQIQRDTLPTVKAAPAARGSKPPKATPPATAGTDATQTPATPPAGGASEEEDLTRLLDGDVNADLLPDAPPVLGISSRDAAQGSEDDADGHDATQDSAQAAFDDGTGENSGEATEASKAQTEAVGAAPAAAPAAPARAAATTTRRTAQPATAKPAAKGPAAPKAGGK